MPPVNSQSSRGGLVAAVVVFTILFVTATIFAIYFSVQEGKTEETLTALRTQYKQIVSNVDSADVKQLATEANADRAIKDPTAMAEAIHQRDEMRRMLIGVLVPTTRPADVEAKSAAGTALDKARDAVRSANMSMAAINGSVIGSDNLIQAVSLLTDTVSKLDSALKAEQARSKAAQDNAVAAAAKANAAAAPAIARLNKTIADLMAARTQTETEHQQGLENVSDIRKTFTGEQQGVNDRLAALTKESDTKDAQLAALAADYDKALKKIANGRPSVNEPTVRHAVGQIIRISDANTVYIDLGRGNQITPGMTFEVYDKNQPLPKLGIGTSDENMPVGKGSIEVVHVLEDSSECHINHMEPGQLFVQGDRLLNVAYSPNAKYKFFVYGNFDPSRTGHPTAAGADTIRRLILQWGGELTDQLDVDTDFVIMGAPVDVPTFTAAELANDPLKQENLRIAKDLATAYDNVLNKAIALHTTILNQNRLFYYTGYYDIAQR